MRKYLVDNKKILISVIISFAIVLGIKIIFCLFALPVRTLSDEIATISGAAYVAEFDWSSVVSNAGYYGVGFTSLLSVFFKIFNDPVVIYRGMLIICAIVQSCSVCIVFYICVHYMNIKNLLTISLMAISSAFFVVTRAVIIYNEHILILISWLCFLLLLKLVEYENSKGKKRIYTLLLMLCMAYALTLHTRSLVLWIALLGTVIFYGWIKKKWLISPLMVIIFGGIGYVISQLFIKFMQSNIWVSSGETLRNASVTLPSTLESVISVSNWHAWLAIILGQINTINIFSGGVVVFFLAFFLHFLWKTFLKKIGESVFFKFIPAIVFFILCIGVTIFGQSITWLFGAASAINEGIFNNAYGVKAFTYIRYMGPYCGPLFFIGCLWLYRMKNKTQSIMFYYKIGLFFLIALSIFWICCVVPYFHQSSAFDVIESYLPFSLSSVNISNVHLSLVLPATFVTLVLYIIYGILLKHKKWNVFFIILSSLLVYEYCYNVINWDYPIQKINYNMASDVCDFIRNSDENIDFSEKIYVQDTRNITDHQIFYEIQILLYDYQIIPMDKNSLKRTDKNFVLITNESDYDDLKCWESQSCEIMEFGQLKLIIGK